MCSPIAVKGPVPVGIPPRDGGLSSPQSQPYSRSWYCLVLPMDGSVCTPSQWWGCVRSPVLLRAPVVGVAEFALLPVHHCTVSRSALPRTWKALGYVVCCAAPLCSEDNLLKSNQRLIVPPRDTSERCVTPSPAYAVLHSDQHYATLDASTYPCVLFAIPQSGVWLISGVDRPPL